jgi:hypothetical protein
MKTISVRESRGVLALSLSAPLPRTVAEWDSVAAAVHHACLGRSARDGLILELQVVKRLSTSEIAGVVNCLINAVRTARIPCRVRMVCPSKAVREAFEVCVDADLAACASYEEAVSQLARHHAGGIRSVIADRAEVLHQEPEGHQSW